MNAEQIAKIDEEMKRLADKKEEIRQCPNYAPELKRALEDFINGKLEGLQWTKENI